MAPVWKIGDEWQYAYKSPTGSGTYVWSMNRLEMIDGVQHYVIQTGSREILYRVSDLASTLERVDGVVVLRETPPRLLYEWPLTVGKSWEQSHRQERPVARTTTERTSLMTVDAEETVTVLAGTFRALHRHLLRPGKSTFKLSTGRGSLREQDIQDAAECEVAGPDGPVFAHLACHTA